MHLTLAMQFFVEANEKSCKCKSKVRFCNIYKKSKKNNYCCWHSCCSSTPIWKIICHAYCGSTLTACIGDLLPWFRKPSLQDMLKAYIIRSRVKTNTNMLIVQPYSPHLFRQGLLPGPGLLYDVLTGKVITKKAMGAWRELEKDRPEMTLHMC